MLLIFRRVGATTVNGQRGKEEWRVKGVKLTISKQLDDQKKRRNVTWRGGRKCRDRKAVKIDIR